MFSTTYDIVGRGEGLGYRSRGAGDSMRRQNVADCPQSYSAIGGFSARAQTGIQAAAEHQSQDSAIACIAMLFQLEPEELVAGAERFWRGHRKLFRVHRRRKFTP